MSEQRQVFNLPTNEIYHGGYDTKVEAGKLAVLGFINEEFVLPEAYREAETETKAWPVLLVNVRDEQFTASPEHPEAYKLVPNYAGKDAKWRLYRGWDTLIQFNGGRPRLWSGEEAFFWETPRAYDQKKLQLAVSAALRGRLVHKP